METAPFWIVSKAWNAPMLRRIPQINTLISWAVWAERKECRLGTFPKKTAPLSAFSKKMHGTGIFFVTYWIPISPNQPKTHKTPRKSHNAVLFCTRCRKYGIPLLYECILRRGSERKHPYYPAKWDTKSSVLYPMRHRYLHIWEKTCIFARQRNGDNPTNTI